MTQCYLIPTHSLAAATACEMAVRIAEKDNTPYTVYPQLSVVILQILANRIVEQCLLNNLEWVSRNRKVAFSEQWLCEHLANIYQNLNDVDGASSTKAELIDKYRRTFAKYGIEPLEGLYDQIHEMIWKAAPKPCWLEATLTSRITDVLIAFGEDYRIVGFMSMREQLQSGVPLRDIVSSVFDIDINEPTPPTIKDEKVYAPIEQQMASIFATAFANGDDVSALVEQTDNTKDKVEFSPNSWLKNVETSNRNKMVRRNKLTKVVNSIVADRRNLQ